MTLLFLDNLPPQINKGAILRFIIEIGGANRDAIGRIERHNGIAGFGGAESAVDESIGRQDQSARDGLVFFTCQETGHGSVPCLDACDGCLEGTDHLLKLALFILVQPSERRSHGPGV